MSAQVSKKRPQRKGELRPPEGFLNRAGAKTRTFHQMSRTGGVREIGRPPGLDL